MDAYHLFRGRTELVRHSERSLARTGRTDEEKRTTGEFARFDEVYNNATSLSHAVGCSGERVGEEDERDYVIYQQIRRNHWC